MGRMTVNQREPALRFVLRVAAALAILFCVSGSAWAGDKDSNKVYTFKVKSDKDNKKDAKGYAVLVDVTEDKIDKDKTKGVLLKNVRYEPRPPLGTLIVFENADEGIKPGKEDTITVYAKNLGKFKKDLKFSTEDTSTLRSDVGPSAPVIQTGVDRIGFKSEKDPIYNILNAPDQSAFTVTDLQYLSNVNEYPDTMDFLDFTNSYGFLPLLPSFTSVPVDGMSPDINVPGPVDDGKWYYVRGIAHFGDFDMPFVHGNSDFQVVPEASSIGLFCAGLLGIGVIRWRPCRRRDR